MKDLYLIEADSLLNDINNSLSRLREQVENIDGFKGATIDGNLNSPCYETFVTTTICRPADLQFAKNFVRSTFCDRIFSYVGSSFLNPLVIWRTTPEVEIAAAPQVIRYAEDGPELDRWTDKKCYKDHNWLSVGAYARLYVQRKAANEEAA